MLEIIDEATDYRIFAREQLAQQNGQMAADIIPSNGWRGKFVGEKWCKKGGRRGSYREIQMTVASECEPSPAPTHTQPLRQLYDLLEIYVSLGI